MPLASLSHLFIQQPCPLIMARIEWRAAPRPALPVILQRIDFTANHLTTVQESVSSQELHGQATSSSSSSTPPVTAVPSPSSSEPASGKIPKPNGEPGRPRSGGFCLDSVLVNLYSWTEDEVARLNVSKLS